MSALTPIHTADEPRPRASLALLRFDPLLLLAGLGLVLCSLATLHAIRGTGEYHGLYQRQAIYAAIGFVLCVLVSRFDYSRLREYRWVLYGLAVVLNLAVYAMPPVQHAHRWIPTPLFSFQSSEFGKILLILALSAFAVEATRRSSGRGATARIMLLALFPAMIVIKQPDLGTGLVYIAIAVSILYFAGTSWRQLAALAALFAVAIALVLAVAPSIGVNVLQQYQKQRLTTFIDPPTVCDSQKDPTCYQLQQGEIALGAGQKTGQGAKGASQITGLFVPEGEDDFVFAAVGDIYGFAGAAIVLSLYALLIWRTLRIMTVAKNLYGTLIAGGILAMLMFQVFLNVGMTLGIAPVTGVPLPLVSYGGSSVIVTFLAIGLLQSIHVQARLASGQKARVLLV